MMHRKRKILYDEKTKNTKNNKETEETIVHLKTNQGNTSKSFLPQKTYKGILKTKCKYSIKKVLSMNYDAIIIGGGLAGYPASIELSRNGYKTLLIEKNSLGGECTNYGCIPTKALIHYAQLYKETNRIPGLQAKITSYEAMVKWREGIVKKLSSGISFLLEKYGVEVINGYAKLKNPNGDVIIETKKGVKKTNGKNILIATGTRPYIPSGFIIDGVRVHDNRSILKLKEKPKSLMIIGGGAIGVEYANAYAQLGTDVTIIELLPTILQGMDRECIRWAQVNLKRLGVKIYTNTYITRMKAVDGYVEATTSRDMCVSTEQALIAAGRKPNTDYIELEKAGVKKNEKGFIIIDDTLRTTNPRIYAAGDAAGPPLLAHKAYMQSLIAAKNIMGIKTIYKQLIPFTVFTIPEIACVGMTEDEARKRKIPYKSAKFYYTALSRAYIDSDGEGVIKILYDDEKHRIMGAHIYGPHASEFITELTLAIEKRITLDEISETIHPHPTISESVREVAELALGKPIHIYLKK